MDIKKINTLESLNPGGAARTNIPSSIPGGPSFRETLERTSNLGSNPLAPAAGQSAKADRALKFSNHAIERMQSRGIKFTPDDLGRLGDAVSRAAAKGSKDSLILMNDSALIVSVKNNTVVTVMDKNALKENVFTNIDSTIVM